MKAAQMDVLMAAGVPRRREGGVAAIIYNLGRELERRGHRVTYLFTDDLFAPDENTGRFRELRFAVRLAAHIRANRDKYSVANLHAPAGCVYGILRSLSPANNLPPYVMMLHGLEERRVHAMSREARKGRAWNFSFKNRLWHRLYHWPRFIASIRTADRAHCYCRDVWTTLQLKYDLGPEIVAYIPNGVEERFFIQRNHERPGPVRLLYAGSWLDQRGIFYLRDALINLKPQFSDWKLTVVGPGAPPDAVKSFFGETLAEQILVLPDVPADDMPQIYAGHDIFVFPSLMEGLPSVLLEAMAAGMPVVTAETCGMVDVVEDGFNGLLVPPANSKALEQALLQLCRQTDLREKLGRAAQETMRRHTWQNSAAKLEQLFASTLKSPGPADLNR
jgi:glycosyltransferase involved in cell wall biosynthesis